MPNTAMAISINTAVRPRKLIVELDLAKFERLVANLGFFSQDFYDSLERAEADYRHGRMQAIKSLRELTK